MFEDSVTYQYIGNVANGGTDDTTYAKDFAAGSIGLVGEDGILEETDSSSSTSKFRIANMLSTGQVVYSPFFVPNDCTITSDTYAADTQQVTYFGYNGSSGSLGTIVSGNVYTLHIEIRQTAPVVGTSPLIKTVSAEATAATEYNIATLLDEHFDKAFAREAYEMIKCERVNSGSETANTGTGNLSVTKGSKYVTAATDVDAVVSVGDLVRFGTTEADPVYMVTALDTSNEIMTLDRPYKGATASAVSSYEFVASADIGNYGLKFTGVDRFANEVTFNPATDYPSLVNFTVNSDDFSSTVETTYDTAAAIGSGTYAQVAALEVYCGMNEYAGRYLDRYPPTNYRSEANSSNTYDTMVIEGTTQNVTWVGTGQKPASKFRIILRTKVSLNGDDVDTALGLTV